MIWLNNKNNILIKQQDNNYTPINFIKNIINQNIQISNQISYNNNIINPIINNPLLFKNKNNITEMNNQFYGVLPREKGVVDYFPGTKNERINIISKSLYDILYKKIFIFLKYIFLNQFKK